MQGACVCWDRIRKSSAAHFFSGSVCSFRRKIIRKRLRYLSFAAKPPACTAILPTGACCVSSLASAISSVHRSKISPAVSASVWKTLESLKEKGLTIFLTSHFMDEVETLCDEICILKKGVAVFRGTVEQAKQQSGCERFEDAYLQLADEEVAE